MIVTKRLYDDGHIKEFDAIVIECSPYENGFLLELDQTAFFPNGGGQLSDEGTLNGITVRDVNEEKGRILHLVDT